MSETPLHHLLAGKGFEAIHWFSPKPGRTYLADPFPWPGSDRILCEAMPLDGGAGRIVAVSEQRGRLTQRQVILDDGAHHSYPCTLEMGGRIYCVPEHTERGATHIYELKADGTLRTVCAVAPHARLADPTLFRDGGRVWIACTDLDIGGHDNLCLLYAPELSGPWIPHAKWPVRIDVRGARPGGSVFRCGDSLFRPGQDCAATYGAAVALHRVEELTETEFSETLVTVLKPDRSGPFPHGLHTVVHDGERFWIDGKRFVFDMRLLRRKVSGRLVRLASTNRGT